MSLVKLSVLRPIVRNYHLMHRDKFVHVIRSVFDADGFQGVLVRLENCAGEPYSAIDDVLFDGNGNPYVKECCSCPREDEVGMVYAFTDRGGEEWNDDQAGCPWLV